MIPITLHLKLDAEALGVSPDDLLWCVSCFASEDPGARLREAPEALMLDQLARVAWHLGVELDIQFVLAEA